MSPLKMFEYMGGGRPIVAADLPSIKEALNNGNAIMVKPDNPGDLARGIKTVLDNNDLAEKTSVQAFKDVEKYTWERRVENILDFIK